MAASEVTPIDEIGMPLPIAPPDYPLPANRREIADWHHHNHPRKDPRLADIGGRALRNVRVQLTDWWDHHMDYHGHYIGPPLPESPSRKFCSVVMAAAGYVPDEVIDFSGTSPQVVPITDTQRERLWYGGELRIAGPGLVRNFLCEYTLGQDISHVRNNLIDEFLNTKNFDRRRFLGHWLLAQATEKAAEPLGLYYRQAWKKGRIPPNVPAKLPTLVQTKLGTVRHRDTLVEQLHHKLAA